MVLASLGGSALDQEQTRFCLDGASEKEGVCGLTQTVVPIVARRHPTHVVVPEFNPVWHRRGSTRDGLPAHARFG
jgi:hypothetical protein